MATHNVEDTVQDTFVELNGLRFHYRDWGNQGAPAVVLLHGMASNVHEWDSVAGVLAERYHVLALDQRGHGETQWAEDYALDRMVEDIDAFVQALGLRQIALLGASMGGINAYLYTARHLGVVGHLVIVDVAPDITDKLGTWSWPDVVPDLEAAVRLARTESTELYKDPEEAFRAARAANPRPPESQQRRTVHASLKQRDDGRWAWRYDPVLRRPIVSIVPPSAAQWALMPRITCPTLLVSGADSDLVSTETAERLLREIPDCRWIVVPESGHGVAEDNPSGLLAAVQPFLDQGAGSH
jgi:pimeloyl-ACP methyl ester carboxylesterase